MKNIILLAVVLCIFIQVVPSYADEDPYAAAMGNYSGTRTQKSDAHATKVYGAWAEDMANQIKSGKKQGRVYEGEDATGIGNITIERGAKVNGPVIVKPEVKNSTVIFTNPKNSRF